MAISTYLSTITLTVNGLYAPTKRHRLDEWMQKQVQDVYKISRQMEEMKKVLHANRNHRKAGQHTHMKQNRH